MVSPKGTYRFGSLMYSNTFFGNFFFFYNSLPVCLDFNFVFFDYKIQYLNRDGNSDFCRNHYVYAIL